MTSPDCVSYASAGSKSFKPCVSSKTMLPPSRGFALPEALLPVEFALFVLLLLLPAPQPTRIRLRAETEATAANPFFQIDISFSPLHSQILMILQVKSV